VGLHGLLQGQLYPTFILAAAFLLYVLYSSALILAVCFFVRPDADFWHDILGSLNIIYSLREGKKYP
jgi:hypothetical protein